MPALPMHSNDRVLEAAVAGQGTKEGVGRGPRTGAAAQNPGRPAHSTAPCPPALAHTHTHTAHRGSPAPPHPSHPRPSLHNTLFTAVRIKVAL
eukprot:scaffold1667_cov98-Isochrysis_galbana.AAC.2